MTAEQLRNSILQEAISGRLVPQDPNDEPASVLLLRIREEKARLVKEGKLKKKDLDETPITEEEIPFEIPASWEWVKISNLIVLLSGRDLEPSHYNSVSEGIAYITGASCIEKGHIIVNRWTTTPVVISKCGDLLISCKGTIGKIAINNIGDCHIARQIMAIRLICGDLLYVRYFIETLTSELKRNAVSMIPGISREDILNSIIPLPPLAEQKRIVAKLEELLPIVEQYGKAQKELDELNAALPARLRQSILQEAISGKLVPQDEKDEPVYLFLERLQNIKEGLVKQKILKKDALSFGVVKEEDIPFEIPANWEWRYLGDLVYLISGTSYKKDDVCNNGIRILRGGNIVNDKLILADDDVFLSEEYRSEEKNIKPNDIVIVASTGSKKVIGKPALVQEPIADTQIGAFLRIVRPIDAAYVPYLWTLFRSEYYRGHIRDLVKGTNINNIKEEYLTYMPIPLPPLAEQQRIVAKIEELFEQIDKISK